MERIKNFLIGSIFLLFDVFIIFLTFKAVTALRAYLTPWFGTEVDYPSIERMMHICILLAITIFAAGGLYPGYGLSAVKELQQISRATMAVFFLLMGVSYLIKSNYNFSRFVLLSTFVLDLFLLPLAHFALRSFLSRLPIYGTAAHIFGPDEETQKIVAYLAGNRKMGWQVEAVFPLDSAKNVDQIHQKAAIAILAANSLNIARAYERELSRKYNKVVVIPKRSTLISHWVEPRDLGDKLGLEFKYNLLEWHSRFIKQSTDLILSIIGIVLLSPVLAISAILIKLDSPGPVIFKQTRMGKGQQPFQLFKFRTMYIQSDEILEKALSKNKSLKKEFDQYHKIRNDPRVTRVGRLLRRYSIDEFPQLFNVLAGDMSLSGPRPYLPAEKAEMKDYIKTILRVKPGISGWWQVLGRNDLDFNRRLEMDEYYIANWSIWMDIYIFMKTFGVILVGKGF